MIAQIDFGRLYGELGQSGGAFTFGKGLTFGEIISGLLPYLVVLAGLLLLLYLLYGGFVLMTSRGDPKAMEKGKGIITTALTGFIIVFVSFWLIQIIGRILGIQAITNIFG